MNVGLGVGLAFGEGAMVGNDLLVLAEVFFWENWPEICRFH